ncbi:PH domain-containing protein [Nocardioides seonyuensis]|uniref:PH domain-containing protein n=1 Tax=Nocardioides seonyuensis TaxID=2518371 RepID=UPI001421AFD1|nr:PH domain-containing protein [Nocardioides seonyuensis]
MIPAPGEGWVRLSPRKVLVDPVKVLRQVLVPALIALVGVSQSGGGLPWWSVPLVALGACAAGVLPWFTTHYRLTETQFQLRSGILNKRTSTAPLDRVRSVDLEASLLHRILGLEKVQVGTGVDDERITLDALDRADARELRTTLLRKSPAPVVAERPGAGTGDEIDAGTDAPGEHDVVLHEPQAPAQLLATIDWSWLRFAPFSLARLVIVAGALGVLSQFGDQLPIWDEDTARSAWDWVTRFTVALVAAVLFIVSLVAWLVISVSGYVVQWWRFRLTRESGALHLTSGLFTTRSVTVEEAKVRGVELTEPVLLRLVGGAELSTLATGLEEGTHQVLPPCPRHVALAVGDQVLGGAGPMNVPLREHGPRARRRSWLRHADGVFLVPLLMIAPFWFFDLAWTWWAVFAVASLVAGAVVGEMAYRHLGHALSPGHLVAGSGALARIRTVLETDGIIGWNLEQSWWQRRSGLSTLVATTAAGSERVVVQDVAVERAVELADAATPGLLTPFLATRGG